MPWSSSNSRSTWILWFLEDAGYIVELSRRCFELGNERETGRIFGGPIFCFADGASDAVVDSDPLRRKVIQIVDVLSRIDEGRDVGSHVSDVNEGER